MFASVRGRDASDSEADRWVVAQMEQSIARIKREAFAAGADRYKPRLLHFATPSESLRINDLRFEETAAGKPAAPPTTTTLLTKQGFSAPPPQTLAIIL